MKRVSSIALGATLSLVVLSFATKAVATITVPTQQPTIQAAINAALPGEQIIVLPGTYIEGAINVTVPVSIEGPNIGLTPSQTRGSEARVVGGFVIQSDNVSIQGCQIVEWAPDNTSHRHAIYGPQALNHVFIASNWILSPTVPPGSYHTAVELGDPIGTARSNDIRVIANRINGDVPGSIEGVIVQEADNVNVVGNKIVLLTMSTSGGDFGWPAVYLDSVRNSVIGKNELECGQSNFNISSVAYGIGLVASRDDCVDVKITDNVVTNGVAGIISHSTDFAIRQTTISRNNIEARIYGISLQGEAFVVTNTLSHEQIGITNNEIKSEFGCVLLFGRSGQNRTFIDVEAHGNCFEAWNGASNVYGIGVSSPVVIPTNGGVVDATKNFWGAPDGPSTVGPGSGVRVTTRVDFTKWKERCNH